MLSLKILKSFLFASLLSAPLFSNAEITLSSFGNHSPVSAWSYTIAHCIEPSNFYLMPPANARMMSMVHQAMFDTLTVYTEEPLLYATTGSPQYSILQKRPSSEHTDANRVIALSYAAYRVLSEVYADVPACTAIFDSFFQSIGGSAADKHISNSDPIGIGNAAGFAVIESRRHDGFNSEGDMLGTVANGDKYSDYTNFLPFNPSQNRTSHTDCSELRDVNRWQPLMVLDDQGNQTTQQWANCQVNNAQPFAMINAAHFRTFIETPVLHGRIGEEQYHQELQQLLNLSASLTDKEKIIVEFWADGDGLSPPTHWLKMNSEHLEAKGLNIVDSIKVQFALSWSIYDAALAAWDVKRNYDTARPITAIQCLFAGQQIKAWNKPYEGTVTINAADWIPYQAPGRASPPFPNYVSGHSTMSAAAAVALENFYQTEEFGLSYTFPAGSSLYEARITNSSDPRYIAGRSDVPNSGVGTPGYSPAADVALSWATFKEAADESGYSRLLGGIHTAQADLQGRKLGKRVGQHVWKKILKYFGKSSCSKNSNSN